MLSSVLYFTDSNKVQQPYVKGYMAFANKVVNNLITTANKKMHSLLISTVDRKLLRQMPIPVCRILSKSIISNFTGRSGGKVFVFLM